MEQNTVNKSDVLMPIAFDVNKAVKQRITAVELSKNIDSKLRQLTAPILPTFGGKEIVVCLAIMQSYLAITKKAQFESTKYFTLYKKGGTKAYVATKDGTKFEQVINGGFDAYKKERLLVSAAEKSETMHRLLIDFASSDVTSFNKTLGEGLQVAESIFLPKLMNGQRILKSNKPLVIAMQVGESVVSTSFIADNSIDSKYLNPATYKGKDETTNFKIWSEFCTNVYQSLKRAMTAGQKISLKDAYKTLVAIK